MNTPSVPAPSAEVRSADVADAIRRIHGHRCHLLDLTSPTPEKVLFGPAATITYVPAHPFLVPAEKYTLANLFYEAVGEDPEGKVLVLASNGHKHASMGGGAKLSRLHNHRLAGVLTDGRLRDLAQLATYDFVTVCGGETTRWGGDEVTAFEAGCPVVLNHVLIRPNDYVFADSGGAVIIPRESVEHVLEMAVRVAREEAAALDAIRDETTPSATTANRD